MTTFQGYAGLLFTGAGISAFYQTLRGKGNAMQAAKAAVFGCAGIYCLFDGALSHNYQQNLVDSIELLEDMK